MKIIKFLLLSLLLTSCIKDVAEVVIIDKEYHDFKGIKNDHYTFTIVVFDDSLKTAWELKDTFQVEIERKIYERYNIGDTVVFVKEFLQKY